MSLERAAHLRELLKRSKHAHDSPASVVREAMREDETVEVLGGDGADPDLCQRG
jgi:hypothetical protein